MREASEILLPPPALTECFTVYSCDSITPKGTTNLASVERGTYGHAQKMRAAVTYAFGRLHGLGDMPWHESEVPGSSRMLGNPSISVQVSTYMSSLCRRKVQAGEVAVSARAITSDSLSKLYHYNHLPQNWSIHPYQPGVRCRQPSEDPNKGCLDDWGGGRARRLVQAAYTIAFICLLRCDEVLKIQLHDIELFEEGFVLTLPFRKTHQNGG
ncbi:hypothetical protein BU15DRAFT_54200 [Melanogaster broomeanus]|nr:hypothetical protein BU15DRAFT_54200 [Melanogaster broomeanus]